MGEVTSLHLCRCGLVVGNDPSTDLQYDAKMLVAILGWIICMNVCAAFAFWSDKARAVAGQRRIPEATLLQLALFGGSPGALVARRVFRHKTRKEPFSTYLLLIVMIQIGAGAGLFLF